MLCTLCSVHSVVYTEICPLLIIHLTLLAVYCLQKSEENYNLFVFYVFGKHINQKHIATENCKYQHEFLAGCWLPLGSQMSGGIFTVLTLRRFLEIEILNMSNNCSQGC